MAELRQQAHDHIQAKRWTEAHAAYERLLAEDDPTEDDLLGYAATLDYLGEFERLDEIAQRILEHAPDSAFGFAYKARALQKLERISEATIANDQALLLDMNLGLAWINRSGLQVLQGKLPEALRSSQRAVELIPEDTRAWANKSVALLNFNRLAEALEAIDRSIEIDPQNLFSLQVKAEVLMKLGRIRDVVPVVRQALAIHPAHVPALTQAVQVYRSLEMYQDLQENAALLTHITPDSLFAWEHYMRALRGQGRFEEANTILDHLLEMDVSNVRFWTLKADTLYRLERYREAVSAAERATRLDLDYPPAHRIHDKAIRLMYQKKGPRKT
ncbi:MAG TPA: tetratricopeptide repeat protein [Ktedonobacteraceae bacterium]